MTSVCCKICKGRGIIKHKTPTGIVKEICIECDGQGWVGV